MKTRLLIRQVEAAGGVQVRAKGSHLLFRLPNGDRVTIPQSGAHGDASTPVEAKVMKALRNQAA